MADEDKQRYNKNMPKEGKYPLQQVIQMEGGHRIIISNDKQSPYIAFFHTSGTHTVYKPDGGVDSFTVGESTSYNKSGSTVTTDNNGDVKVSGHKKIHVSGGGHIEIQGDANIVAGGGVNLIALGGLGAAVNGNAYIAAQGKLNVNAPDMNFKASSMTFNADSAIAMNTPQMGIKAEISHEGNMKTSGIHTDSTGKHTG